MHYCISETHIKGKYNRTQAYVHILKYKCWEIVFAALIFHLCNSTHKTPRMLRAPKPNNVTAVFLFRVLKIQNNDHYRFLPYPDI